MRKIITSDNLQNLLAISNFWARLLSYPWLVLAETVRVASRSKYASLNIGDMHGAQIFVEAGQEGISIFLDRFDWDSSLEFDHHLPGLRKASPCCLYKNPLSIAYCRNMRTGT